MLVPGYGIGWLPSVRGLLRNRCIEHDQVELVLVLGWDARRSKQSKLVYEGKLGSQLAKNFIICAGPLEDLQWWGESG